VKLRETPRAESRQPGMPGREEDGSPETVSPLPSMTVVICAYTTERWPDLVAAVESVHGQEHAVDELIVVIDHCPELAERARRELADATVLDNSSTQGLSGARNTGVAAAHGEIVAFLDDDAAADPRWSTRILASYTGPEVLGVGGQVDANWKTARPGWFPTEFDWVVGCSYRGLPARSAPVRNFIGANMSIRRSALESAGGFRSDLGRIGRRPLGCEETELCIRIGRSRPDAVLLHEPSAVVRHNVPALRASWSYFRARCFAEGLSKAAVTRYCGTDSSLSSEREYLRSTIPSGFAAALRHGRIRTAAALLAGVALTALGYLVGRLRPVRPAPGSEATQADPAQQASPAVSVAAYIKFLAPPVAIALWLIALGGVNPAAMNDLGLISVLPPTYWAALAILTVGFSVAVRDRRSSPLLLLGYVLALIAIVHATPTLAYSTLRYSWAWKHVSIIDYLLRHNALDPNSGELAAYYQWPGFFTLNTLILKMTGLASAQSYAAWAPPVLNAMMLGPLLLIFRSAARDRRLQWTGLWVFYCGSWVGQDYFSPQGFAFVLYLAVLAVLLKRLAQGRSGGSVGRLGLLILPIAAIDSSHQLTPILLVTACAALAIERRSRRVALYILGTSCVVMAAWDATVARPFLSQNLGSLLKSFGTLDANAGGGMISLAAASTGQVIVADIDRALSAGIWTLALWALVRRRHRLGRARLLLLMLAPLPAIVANNYGGEMLFRVYFFSLPGAALLAAAALIPRSGSGHARLAAIALPTALAALVTALLFSYYGKEQMNYFSPAQVQAAQYLDSHAPSGSLIIAETPNYPDAYADYEKSTRIWLLEEQPGQQSALLAVENPIAAIRTSAQNWDSGPVYFILTESQIAEIQMGGLLTADGLAGLLAGLTPANGFTAVYRNADAAVFRVAPPVPGSVLEGAG